MTSGNPVEKPVLVDRTKKVNTTNKKWNPKTAAEITLKYTMWNNSLQSILFEIFSNWTDPDHKVLQTNFGHSLGCLGQPWYVGMEIYRILDGRLTVYVLVVNPSDYSGQKTFQK